MIEIICKEESAKENRNRNEETICLPKNIRQEGSPRGRHKIYLEDYVHTYLKNAAKSQDRCAAVFLGKSQVAKDIRYTFISGLVECTEAVFQWESISLDDSFWDYIYKEEKQYFPDLEIVGWFLAKSGQVMELSPAVEAAHRKYFSGRDKILMLMDILEEEELFFVYEQGYLQKREGYYIYYEKNLAMQEYMICKREEEQKLLEELKTAQMQEEVPEKELESQDEEQTEEPMQAAEEAFEKKENSRQAERDAQAMLEQMRKQEKKAERRMREGFSRAKTSSQDKVLAKSNLEEPKSQAEEALEAYRRTILERQGRSRERQSRRLLYTASSFFLVVICVIGISTINNYKKMQQVEEVLRVINPEEPVPKKETIDDNELVVKSVESQVSPLDNQQNSGSAGEKKDGGIEDSTEASDNIKGGAVQGAQEPDGNSGPADAQAEGASADPEQEEKTVGNKEEEPEDTASQENKSPEGGGQEDNTQEEDIKQEDAQDKPQETAGQVSEPRYYTVQPGDTLSTICMNVYKNESMIQTLKEVNGIEDGDKIFAGQRLLLP
ncbi:MAG: LysM peptidoglycan-binding domain-containing protein [Lachnospiraceae bacterium]|nr:LysM peptidoglycan-binding domain-containing protein [Lachnospiraceae bacterium]